ncbi:hypothetical protein PEC18_29860 [Paucibacter sp. O1-1]|nr:hypothetical protein [Paucibacter sp. O1-1]MDA3829933.1 hypothetical protein [Paucibacter sp. O1-1]
MPLLFISDSSASFVSAASVCSAGSISGQLNGGALPAAGSAVPATGTLSATASACETDGTVYNGSASVSYNLSSLEPTVGTATGTVTAMRLTDRSGSSVSRDITANGSATVTLSGSSNGGNSTQTVSIAPATSATLRNELSGLTASFAGGSVAALSETSSTSSLPTRTRLSYNDLRFAVAGVNYLASGFYEVSFSAQGGYAGGSGEVLLSSGGVAVGRLYANASGIFIEVNGISQPFKATRALAR